MKEIRISLPKRRNTAQKQTMRFEPVFSERDRVLFNIASSCTEKYFRVLQQK